MTKETTTQKNSTNIAVIMETIEGLKEQNRQDRIQNEKNHQELKDQVALLTNKIEAFISSERFVTRREHESLKEEMETIQSNNTWLIRLFVGAIVVQIIAFIAQRIQ